MAHTNVKMQTLFDASFVGRAEYLQGRSLNRLSSGSRLLVPSDDPVGVGVAGKMEAQGKRIDAAQTNVQGAVSLVQSTDGYLAGMGRLLTRMAELAQYAMDPSKNPEDTALYGTEFVEMQRQLRATIGGSTAEIGGTTAIPQPLGSFNELVLFGPRTNDLLVATGKSVVDRLTVPETNLRTGSMLAVIQQDAGGAFTLSIDDPTVIAELNSAIDEIAGARADLGAVGSRLELIGESLQNEGEALTNSVSRIQDVDVARETTRLARMNLLSQTSTAMLAQAAGASKSVLQLLQGS